MLRVAAGVAIATLLALTGCANMDQSACRGVAIGTGALLGATAGGLGSGVAAEHGRESEGSKNWEIGLVTGGGAALGALLGWGLSEAICGEAEAAPPPPPPPPPAAKAPPPPPPPPAPPVTQRRGG